MSTQAITPAQSVGPFFCFALPYKADANVVHDCGLPRLHTRMCFPGTAEAIAPIREERRHMVMAAADERGYRFDPRLQGANETEFIDV